MLSFHSRCGFIVSTIGSKHKILVCIHWLCNVQPMFPPKLKNRADRSFCSERNDFLNFQDRICWVYFRSDLISDLNSNVLSSNIFKIYEPIKIIKVFWCKSLADVFFNYC